MTMVKLYLIFLLELFTYTYSALNTCDCKLSGLARGHQEYDEAYSCHNSRCTGDICFRTLYEALDMDDVTLAGCQNGTQIGSAKCEKIDNANVKAVLRSLAVLEESAGKFVGQNCFFKNGDAVTKLELLDRKTNGPSPQPQPAPTNPAFMGDCNCRPQGLKHIDEEKYFQHYGCDPATQRCRGTGCIYNELVSEDYPAVTLEYCSERSEPVGSSQACQTLTKSDIADILSRFGVAEMVADKFNGKTCTKRTGDVDDKLISYDKSGSIRNVGNKIICSAVIGLASVVTRLRL